MTAYFLPLGFFFLLLVNVFISAWVIYCIFQLKPLTLELEYLAGTTDMILETQKEQTKLIVALLENS